MFVSGALPSVRMRCTICSVSPCPALRGVHAGKLIYLVFSQRKNCLSNIGEIGAGRQRLDAPLRIYTFTRGDVVDVLFLDAGK